MNKKDLKLIVLFLIVLVGYFLGSTVYALNFAPNNVLSVLSSIASALILGGLYLLFLKKKHPKVIYDMVIEQNDEREKMIREKAAHYTLISIFGLSFSMAGISIIRQDFIILFFSGGLYILLLMIYLILIAYFKKKL